MMESRIEGIDFLKGIAIAEIILVHAYYQAENCVPWQIGKALFMFGATGCQLFFLLSGFCLARAEDHKTNSAGTFIYKRFCGIAPAYYAVVLFYIVLNGILRIIGGTIGFAQNVRVPALISNLLLLHGILREGHNDVVPGGWYIGVLWLFYLLFPLGIRNVARLRQKSIYVLGGLPVIVFGVNQILCRFFLPQALAAFHMENIVAYEDIMYNIPIFLLGMVLYEFYDMGKLQLSDQIKKLYPFLLVFLFAAAVSDYYLRIINYQFTAGLFYGGLLIWVLNGLLYRRKCGRYTVGKQLVAMGQSSYGIYFVHFVFVCYGMPVIIRLLRVGHGLSFLKFLIALAILFPFILWCGKGWQKCINFMANKLVGSRPKQKTEEREIL